MSSTAIVTGAAGFIGSHLAEQLLSRGYTVVGIDNFDLFYGRARKQANLAGLDHPNFRFVEADICDRELIAQISTHCRPDIIFHIAALAGVRPSIEQPDRYTSVNVDGLVNVLDAARGVRCRKLVFASSSSVYGNNEKVPFAETDPVDEPISPYAATKRAGELLCHTYSHLFDLSIACLRFFTVYGPAQRPDLAIAKFMRLMADDREIPVFGDGESSRDYTYIDDIIAGVLAAADYLAHSDAEHFRIFNLGGSQPVKLAALIELIAQTVGKPPEIARQPMQPGDVNHTYADLARSAQELGYQPQTRIEEGLRRQWEWYQSTMV